MPNKILLSPLKHTWILDFDGTLVKHNGYKTGKDEWLPGAIEFLKSIPEGDLIILLTAREEAVRKRTLEFISRAGVRVDSVFFEVPMGERVLINDTKPSGLVCAHAVTPWRNQGLADFKIVIDKSI